MWSRLSCPDWHKKSQRTYRTDLHSNMACWQMYRGLCLFLALFHVCTCLRWSSENRLPDGVTIPNCDMQDVVLDWDYVLAADEHVVNVEWRFTPSGTTADIILATAVNGHFFADPSASSHMQYVPGAGLRLLRVTGRDSGTYSVHVHLSQHGSGHTHVQSAHVVITEASVSTRDVLEARLQGARFFNSTQQHQLILACGHFDTLWTSKVKVLWTTPTNQTLPSTFQENDQYLLAVPNPFQSGDYKCEIDGSSPASVCIPSNSPLLGGATVTVDAIEGQLSLMDSEVGSIKGQIQTLQGEKDQMVGEVQKLQANTTALAGELQALQDQKTRLENDLHSRYPDLTG